MIEIPEAINLANEINDTLRGLEVRELIAGASPHKFAWYYGDPAEYPDMFRGRRLEGAKAYGGKLRLDFDDDFHFLFYDGTTPRIYKAGEKLPVKHQLFADFGEAQLVCTIRMYGAISGFRGDPEQDFERIAREKPDVLSDDFTFEYFCSLRPDDRKKLSAKALLATQQRIPGLGNGVLQDILFKAGVSPRHDVSREGEDVMRRLYDAVREVLSLMVEQGGRDTEPNLFGDPGGYQTVMSRNNSNCPLCGGEIKREAYMGGNVYYCPACQK